MISITCSAKTEKTGKELREVHSGIYIEYLLSKRHKKTGSFDPAF